MEVAPSSSMEFNFDSTSSSPYITAPSSPQRFPNFFFSAPASPRRHSSAATTTTTASTTEFQFDFGVHLPRPSLSADELFLAGKIRPLELQPPPPPNPKQKQQPITEPSSPLESCDDDVSSRKSSSSKSGETSFLWFTRKWRIKDFLLFRSASEGRASDKDPFRKYAVLSKTTAHEDVRNSSFRSAQSSGSVSRRRGPVSAHELHYTVNRAASVQSKKKTLLPYKQGLLGCLGFNTGSMHHITATIASSHR